MSKYYTEEKWIEKKISQGYFGFDVCELNKIYSQEEITKLEKFFHLEVLREYLKSTLLIVQSCNS